MNKQDIPKIRLQTQRLVGSEFTNPAEVVSWMGAVQAQHAKMSMMAVAIRMKQGTFSLSQMGRRACSNGHGEKTSGFIRTMDDVVGALNQGTILRTHILRPTWHLVAAEDIRWMSELSRDYLRRACMHYGKMMGETIYDDVKKKGFDIIGKTLAGGNCKNRSEIAEALKKAGMWYDSNTVRRLMSFAEIEGLVCSGLVKPNEFTYMLMDDRAPKREDVSREEAIARLARKYFQSHSPAQLVDFTWWSGLTKSEAKRGIEAIRNELAEEHIADRTYYIHESFENHISRNTSKILLPAYDEYLISYKYRYDVLKKENELKAYSNNGLFQPVLLDKGKVVGNWKQEGTKTIKTLWT